jgi:hypothetical protein
MSAHEGSSEDFAKLAATLRGEPARDEKGVDREAIARAAGLPPGLADRLRGETTEEVEADAEVVASSIGVEPEPEHIQLARRALEAAEDNPNKGELMALAMPKDNSLVRRLHQSTDGEDS